MTSHPGSTGPQATQDILASLHTVRDWLRYGVSRFVAGNVYCGHGNESPWDDAVQLVMQTLNLPLVENVQFLDARLVSTEKTCLLERIERRVHDRVPVAYLTGEAWFMGLAFFVDERVLIPRSPLAEFLAVGGEPWLAERPVRRILDLCTGSGCIGIAAALQFPEAQVDLADISPEALAVAERNIARYDLQDRVRAVQSDLFDQLEGPYDLIISNPPYVDEADLASMPAEYHHEPALGLASGPDGLDLTRRMLDQAARYLTPDGVLVVEVGNSAEALDEARDDLPFTWLEFDQGGHGVFLLNRQDLPG
ncbi:MAG: 50S ribosomal protein L3 N(5)-glutamine methyltransferase [Halomonadaceae bacterium]|nr:MAG: 50S ribosomal protein L3 N(5)-glutamine methyltransferase [Halomonadaceae bacterium]